MKGGGFCLRPGFEFLWEMSERAKHPSFFSRVDNTAMRPIEEAVDDVEHQQTVSDLLEHVSTGR